MLRRFFIAVVILATGVLLGRYLWPVPQQPAAPLDEIVDATAGHAAAHTPYVCPMHPEVVSDKPGTCPSCGMALVQAKPAEPTVSASTHEAVAGHGAADTRREADAPPHPVVQIDPQVLNNLGVRTARVTRATLLRRIDTPGFVQQIEAGPYKPMQTPFDARVTALHVESGQWVDGGKPLLELESEVLRDAEQAHLTLLEGKQPSAMQAPGAIRPTTLGDSRRYLAQLGLSTADIQHLEQTRAASARWILSAPYTVRVSNIEVAVDDTVAGGAHLFDLTGLARATVLANAFQRDATWIQAGQPVEVKLPHVSAGAWPGVVNQAEETVDPDSQNIGVRVSFSAPMELLKSAMYVVATIHGGSHVGVLAVPREALIRTETEDRVILAQGGGRFKPVPVRVGIESGGQAEILDGLEEGAEVVVSAQFLIDSESSLQASFLRMSTPGPDHVTK